MGQLFFVWLSPQGYAGDELVCSEPVDGSFASAQPAALSSSEREKLLRAPEATGADLPVMASLAGVLRVPLGEVQG